MSTRAVSAASMLEYFESLPEPRHERNRKHLLLDVVVIAICGVICGCDGPTAIARWGRLRSPWLQQFLELPNGIPSRDCIRRVLMALKPTTFQECFVNWLKECVGVTVEGEPNHIAIDGKVNRRSHDANAGLGALHLVSALSTANGIILGQEATDAKSNEITAIPVLLERLDLTNALVTIDAIGCQHEIAEMIVAGGGGFCLAVKENQPKLFEATQSHFLENMERRKGDRTHRHVDVNEVSHGCIEERTYCVAKLPADFAVRDEWKQVRAIGCAVRRTVHADGRETSDVRYYILSKFVSGSTFATCVRRHWQIENSLHWVLDMNFREDENRTRERVLADNLSWLRRFAISLHKQHPLKESIRGKMQMAGWDTEFLAEVLGLQGL